MKERNLDPDRDRDLAYKNMLQHQRNTAAQEAAFERDYLSCEYQAKMHEFFFGDYLGDEK